MIRWISMKFLGNKTAVAPVKGHVFSSSYLLEQSTAYSAFLSSQDEKGEKLSFEEFLGAKILLDEDQAEKK